MIDLLPDDDQQAVADNIADVLSREAPVARLRNGASEDAGLQGRLAALGWLGLGLAEADGGVGYGLAEEIILCRGIGRHLLPPGILAASLGARLAARAGRPEITEALVSGAATACLLSPLEGTPAPRTLGLFHRLDGEGCDYAVVIGPSGAALFDNADLLGEPIRGLDDAVALERARLDDRPAVAWVEAGTERLDLRMDVLTAAILCGAAEGARDLAVDYAGVREQFGQPIGAFQGIKHQCADMAVRCEAAWSLIVFAALALEDIRPDAEFQVLAARTIAGDAAIQNATRTVQVHGGIGFTAECDAQLFVKRARLWDALGVGRRARLSALLAQPEPVRAAKETAG